MSRFFDGWSHAAVTQCPKPKKDDNGKCVKNGAAAKSWLNKAILNAMWGNIVTFTTYKGLKQEKLTIETASPGTSRECFNCGHTHPDNRVTQADFLCRKCGYADNAGHNAALVIKRRGIRALLRVQNAVPGILRGSACAVWRNIRQ